MNPLQRIMSQTLRYIQRHFAKMAALMLAVLVAVGSLLPYDAMPVLAAEDTEDYCHLSLSLYPEGETAEKTVVLNGVMPKEASATAVDVTDDFIGREGGTDLSEENPHASLLAAYDITITDKSGEYQPDQDKPILVEISHPMQSEENDYEIWHIHDNGEKERISAFTVEDGLIRFTAAGFSVEISNIPVGTKFRMEEKENEIPAGYSFVSYERIDGSYHIEDGDTLNSGWVRANESPKMIVSNRRGWSMEVRKVWSDQDFTVRHDPVYMAVYCGETLVPDTVSCMAHPSTVKRYFFDSLQPGTDFADYTVCEVELDDPVVNANGELISYSGIRKRLSDGDQTIVNAVARDGDTAVPHAYAVTYHYGTPASQAHGTDVIDNVRTDTITNTRTDGIALTLFDMHTLEPLAQGQFTLTQGDTILGRYTSDAQGRITVFYDFERNTDYTLTENEPPAGYIGLPNAAVFSIGSDDTVTISGNEPQWQKVRTADPATDHLMAYIDVYNKPYTLTVLKVDSVTAELKASNARSTGAKKTRFPWPTGIGYIYTNNCGRYCL